MGPPEHGDKPSVSGQPFIKTNVPKPIEVKNKSSYKFESIFMSDKLR